MKVNINVQIPEQAEKTAEQLADLRLTSKFIRWCLSNKQTVQKFFREIEPN